MGLGAAASVGAKAAIASAKRVAARMASVTAKGASAAGKMAAAGAKGSWTTFRSQPLWQQGMQVAGAGLGFWGLAELCKGSGGDGDDSGDDSSDDTSIFTEAQAMASPAMDQGYYMQGSYDPYYMPSESYIKNDGSYVMPSSDSYSVDIKELAEKSDENPMISVGGRKMSLNEYMYEYPTGINYNA